MEAEADRQSLVNDMPVLERCFHPAHAVLFAGNNEMIGIVYGCETVLVSHTTPFDSAYRQMLEQLTGIFQRHGDALAVANQNAHGVIYELIGKQAAMQGYIDNYRMLATICLLLVPVPRRQRVKRLASRRIRAVSSSAVAWIWLRRPLSVRASSRWPIMDESENYIFSKLEGGVCMTHGPGSTAGNISGASPPRVILVAPIVIDRSSLSVVAWRHPNNLLESAVRKITQRCAYGR
ncbi:MULTISPECIES: hypothetical protein [unclassified Bradyrhizobium]|uniref:hypothetical protein n=1 Tax=unclassified Bradyrhizobium TaxID=2631580 RepID=UPI002011A1C2|nr:MULTISPECIES: hypothetical protein [unclassified Bradyrhizobium]